MGSLGARGHLKADCVVSPWGFLTPFPGLPLSLPIHKYVEQAPWWFAQRGWRESIHSLVAVEQDLIANKKVLKDSV